MGILVKPDTLEDKFRAVDELLLREPLLEPSVGYLCPFTGAAGKKLNSYLTRRF